MMHYYSLRNRIEKKHPKTKLNLDLANEVSSDPFIAGRILPFLSKLYINDMKAKAIWTALKKEAHFADFAFIAVLGFAVGPISRILFQSIISKLVKYEWKDSLTKQISDALTQVAKIAFVVYLVDCLDIVLTAMDFHFAKRYEFSRIVAKILYVVWAARKTVTFKSYFISNAERKSKSMTKMAQVSNRLLDIVIYGVFAFILIDMLSLEIGIALSSIFAFGGAGTLVFSLASKDIASQFVSGLAISAANKFTLGEEILLGDGTKGHVTRMGWMETVIRGPDELSVRIPNSQVYAQRIINISRMKQCQVEQTLRFKYEDLDRIQNIFQDIKKGIEKLCPTLITDGSRPYRINVVDFCPDHVSVKLNCHFDTPPTGPAYAENRQKVLMAVAMAMKKNDAQFALPAIQSYVFPIKSDGDVVNDDFVSGIHRTQ